jgi:DNA-nicking Smr family endonuclease
MGRKHRRPADPAKTPRRGKRRSIRYDAVDDPSPPTKRGRPGPPPPEIHLRRMPAERALAHLDAIVPAHARLGKKELLIVHGRGQNSPGGQSVLGPLVRQWCDDHPDVVASWREAPAAWGGPGAIVIVLR